MIYDWYSLSRFVVLSKQLLDLLRAGTSLDRALILLRPNTTVKRLQTRYTEVESYVLRGDDFMSAWSNLLPDYMRISCLAFEGFPDHELSLTYVCRFYEQRFKQAVKTGRQLIYPSILLVSIFILLMVFLTVIFPQYRQFFSSNQLSDPFLVRVISGVIEFWLRFGWLMLGVGGIVVAIVIWLYWAHIKRRLFRWFFSIHHTDILHLLVLTQSQNIPLRQSLRQDLFMLLPNGSVEYKLFLTRFLDSGDFSKSWADTFVLPAFYRDWLIQLRSGPTFFESVSSFCQAISIYLVGRQKRRLALVNPILLVCLAGLILLFLVTMYMPLLSLSNIAL